MSVVCFFKHPGENGVFTIPLLQVKYQINKHELTYVNAPMHGILWEVAITSQLAGANKCKSVLGGVLDLYKAIGISCIVGLGVGGATPADG